MSRARALAVIVAGVIAGAALSSAVGAGPASACTGWGSDWTPAAGSTVPGTVGTSLVPTVITYDSGLSSLLTLDSVAPDPATLGLTVSSQVRFVGATSLLDIYVTGTPTHAGTQQLTFTVAGIGVGCGAGTEAAAFDFTFGQGSQSIAAPAPTPGVRAGQSLALSATATSGLPVTYSVAPAASTVCSVSGATLSFLTAGTCTVEAAQAGSADWLPAGVATVSYTVLAADPPAASPAPPVNPAPPADPGPQLAATGLPVAPLLWLATVLALLGCALLSALRFAPRLSALREANRRR